ncbi:MAG: hypothetical protein U9O98_00660 [Asgard group archaeon]|nr:hypothetical protein [Asgard group archaeon]
MRVGVASSSKNLAIKLKKNLVIIFVMSILYALNSFAIGEIKLQPGIEGGGELRPLIFIPALAAILFGPMVGAFSAGIGNLLMDIINDTILEPSILDLSNLAGLLGNFVGALVVGILGWQLKFDKDDAIFFSGKNWLHYLQNTLAAIIGMGLVTGETIGLLSVAFNKATWSFGNSLSAMIFYSNTFFLLISFIPLQLIIATYEKIRAKRYHKSLLESKKVTVIEEPENPPAKIEEIEIIPGEGQEGLIKDEWSQIKLVIRNQLTIPTAFRIEINCEDRVAPSVDYTYKLEPNETDEKFFQINPFNDSERVFTIYIKNWSSTFKELTKTKKIGTSIRYRFTYNTLTPFEHRFNTIMKFLSICTFAVIIFNGFRTVFSTSGIDIWQESHFIWALVVCGVELILVIGFYIYKLVQVRRKIAKTEEKLLEKQLSAKEREEKQQRSYEEGLKEISEQYDLEIAETEEEPSEIDSLDQEQPEFENLMLDSLSSSNEVLTEEQEQSFDKTISEHETIVNQEEDNESNRQTKEEMEHAMNNREEIFANLLRKIENDEEKDNETQEEIEEEY